MTDNAFILDRCTTALVLIDLQRGIAGRQVAPHSAEQVIANCAQLAECFRAFGAPVVHIDKREIQYGD